MKTALCLDDEVLVALNTADTIGDLGFATVHVAHNVAKAEDVLDKGAVDLAVLDMNLGQGETTFDIARQVRAQGGKVIFASGYGRAELPDDLADAALVDKPTSPALLRKLVGRLLAQDAELVSQ